MSIKCRMAIVQGVKCQNLVVMDRFVPGILAGSRPDRIGNAQVSVVFRCCIINAQLISSYYLYWLLLGSPCSTLIIID